MTGEDHSPTAIGLAAADAVELAELLEFLGGWLQSDSDNLAASAVDAARLSRCGLLRAGAG